MANTHVGKVMTFTKLHLILVFMYDEIIIIKDIFPHIDIYILHITYLNGVV